jgi:amino acid adenylation domain-containing protein
VTRSAVIPSGPPQLAGPPLTAPAPADVLQLVRRSFVAIPDAPAVRDPSGCLTYRQLDRLSSGLARRLGRTGVGRGDRVLLHATRSRWAIVGMLGILRAGAAYVPLDAGFPPERQAAVRRCSRARCIVTESGVASRLAGEGAEEIVVDELAGAEPAGDLVEGPGELAYVLFTSGSTGEPKGVLVSSGALAYSTAARLQQYPERVRRSLLCPSISFDSSVSVIYWTLASGGELLLSPGYELDLDAIADGIERHGCTHIDMVPSLYGLLVVDGLAPKLRPLRVTALGGEVCHPSLVEAHHALLPHAQLFNEYGPTECTVWATVHACTGPPGPTVPIGRPIPGTVLYVCDDDGRPTAPDEPGELWIGGPGVADGYLDRPEETAANFGVTAAGRRVYRTGDRVAIRPDGLLEFLGRSDGQIKIGGLRMEVGEIEAALLADPSVVEAAVVPEVAAGRVACVRAFVVAAADLDERALRARLRSRLPRGALPRSIERLPRLPRLPTGKVDRAALAAGTRRP